MAEYRPLLIRAISRLEANTQAGRQSVYANARAGLVALLTPGGRPSISEDEFRRERRALEDAIRQIESSMTVGAANPRRPLTTSCEKNETHVVHEVACGYGPCTISEFFSASDEKSFDFQPFDHEAEPECTGSQETDAVRGANCSDQPPSASRGNGRFAFQPPGGRVKAKLSSCKNQNS
jgi:hypothetical protein